MSSCPAHVCRSLCRSNKDAGFTKQELEAVVSHLIWVLGIELGSSQRAASACNH